MRPGTEPLRRRIGSPLACTALAMLAWAAAAQSPDADALRPTGPVTLTADRGEWVESGEMIYEGNVTLQSDTLKLAGARMTVTQLADGQFQAQILGSPARLDHAGRAGASGIAAQHVSAEGERIDYDSRRGVIQLNTRARLQRGGDEVTGEKIDYIVAERRVRASGGSSGQVRIVIQPPAPAATPLPTPAAAPHAETP
jgi:lipopolysaccharide export system protein LptA